MKNKVVVYPIPEGAARQRDYIVRVRPAGEEQWQEVGCYQVRVDMHHVSLASMAYFDFQGTVEVEVTFTWFYELYKVDIRPLSQAVVPVVEPKRVHFVLDHPANLSVEFNEERFRNLHLFAGFIEEEPDKQGENVLVIKGAKGHGQNVGDEINQVVGSMPEGRLVYIEAGIHYVTDCLWRLPSHTGIYLEGGAILKGALVCEHAEDIHIYGRGMIELANFERFNGVNGLRISHSRNVTYRNIRIEPFAHGKVLDFQVRWNKDYNPAPGRLISNICLEDIYVMTGRVEEPSCICGYDEQNHVENIEIRSFFRDGVRAENLQQANIVVGAYAENVVLQ